MADSMPPTGGKMQLGSVRISSVQYCSSSDARSASLAKAIRGNLGIPVAGELREQFVADAIASEMEVEIGRVVRHGMLRARRKASTSARVTSIRGG